MAMYVLKFTEKIENQMGLCAGISSLQKAELLFLIQLEIYSVKPQQMSFLESGRIGAGPEAANIFLP